VPVHAQVDGVEGVGPLVGVGKAAGEDALAQAEGAVAALQLDRPGTELPLLDAERPERLDLRPPVDRLAGQEVARGDVIRTDGNLGPIRSQASGVALVAALPLAHE